MTKTPYAEPMTLSFGSPPPTKPRTIVATCTKCEVPEEISVEDAKAINLALDMKREPEKCCRVCGEPFSRCPVGGM